MSDLSRGSNPDKGYLSYLLRLWVMPGEAGNGSGGWRASTQSPITQELFHFPNLESLFAFLREQTGQLERSDHSLGILDTPD